MLVILVHMAVSSNHLDCSASRATVTYLSGKNRATTASTYIYGPQLSEVSPLHTWSDHSLPGQILLGAALVDRWAFKCRMTFVGCQDLHNVFTVPVSHTTWLNLPTWQCPPGISSKSSYALMCTSIITCLFSTYSINSWLFEQWLALTFK